MANSNAPMFIQTIQNWAFQFVNGTGTTITTVATAGANGSKIEDINVSNTDAGVAYTLQLYLNDGSTNHLLTSINIPLSAGNVTGTPPVSLFASYQWAQSLPFDNNGNRYLYIKNGWSLKAAVTVAVTAAKAVDVVASGGDF